MILDLNWMCNKVLNLKTFDLLNFHCLTHSAMCANIYIQFCFTRCAILVQFYFAVLTKLSILVQLFHVPVDGKSSTTLSGLPKAGKAAHRPRQLQKFLFSSSSLLPYTTETLVVVAVYCLKYKVHICWKQRRFHHNLSLWILLSLLCTAAPIWTKPVTCLPKLYLTWFLCNGDMRVRLRSLSKHLFKSKFNYTYRHRTV